MPPIREKSRHRRDKPLSKKGKGRSYGGASADQRSADRHEKLIDAGLKVIGSVGYHAATVRAICAEAGLTERYFYESFGNSEALLRAVYNRIIRDVKQQTQTAMLTADRDPEAIARALISKYLEICRDPHVARVMLFEVLGVSPEVDQLYRQAMGDFAALISTTTQMLYPHRQPDHLDQEMIAQGMIGAVVQIATRWVLGGYTQPLDSVVTSAYVIFMAVNRQVFRLPEKAA